MLVGGVVVRILFGVDFVHLFTVYTNLYLVYLFERSEFLIATSPPQNLYFVRVFD